jgi:hypothetical protein
VIRSSSQDHICSIPNQHSFIMLDMIHRSSRMSREDYILLMLADSALPTGGFIASNGLEASTKIGLVRSIPQLTAYIKSSLENLYTSTFPCITRLIDQMSLPDLDSDSKGIYPAINVQSKYSIDYRRNTIPL